MVAVGFWIPVDSGPSQRRHAGAKSLSLTMSAYGPPIEAIATHSGWLGSTGGLNT